METFPLNLNVNSFSPLPLLSLNHLSIFLVKKLQPLSFRTKLTNLEKRLSINSSTSGYLYCLLFNLCDMYVKTSPCTVHGEHFFASSCLIFASTLMASWTHFSYVKGFQQFPTASPNLFWQSFASSRFTFSKVQKYCSSIGEFTYQKC